MSVRFGAPADPAGALVPLNQGPFAGQHAPAGLPRVLLPEGRGVPEGMAARYQRVAGAYLYLGLDPIVGRVPIETHRED